MNVNVSAYAVCVVCVHDCVFEGVFIFLNMCVLYLCMCVSACVFTVLVTSGGLA